MHFPKEIGLAGVDGLKPLLDTLYARYNRRELIEPDPLQFVVRYHDPLDQEIVGLLAASLAYGRVGTIVKKCNEILSRLGPCPRAFVTGGSGLKKALSGFRHRFHTGEDCAALLLNCRRLILEHGSLGHALKRDIQSQGGRFLAGLTRFVDQLTQGNGNPFIMPNPERGSACKRLFLYLRWMVRKDEVDPGCWHGMLSPSDLLFPLDTHLFSIGKALGFTLRSAPDLKAAGEITAGFKEIEPKDPVKYDFCLTRFGIHPRFTKEALFCLLRRFS